MGWRTTPTHLKWRLQRDAGRRAERSGADMGPGIGSVRSRSGAGVVNEEDRGTKLRLNINGLRQAKAMRES
jgi:hypothetical protein